MLVTLAILAWLVSGVITAYVLTFFAYDSEECTVQDLVGLALMGPIAIISKTFAVLSRYNVLDKVVFKGKRK